MHNVLENYLSQTKKPALGWASKATVADNGHDGN
jgi:hypothetical protein